MPRAILALIAALAGLLVATPASACSSTSDYVAPSNFELVQMADAIGVYVAEPPPQTNSGPASPTETDELALHPFGAPLVFRLERSLLGRPPGTMGAPGLAGLVEPYPHDPEDADLALRNPDYGGGCTRMTFERGARYLLILQRDAGGWYLAPDGGNRAMEDYGGEASLWARTVRRYIALRPLNEAARTAALTAMRDSGRDRYGTPLLPAERNDIAHHLRAPSQWKPTAWLLDRYERAVHGEAVDIVLEGPIQFAQLQGDRAHTLLTSLANGRHPGAGPLFERLLEAPGSDGRDLALALRYFSGNGQYQRAWRWIETRLANRLLTLDTGDAQILLGGVVAVQRGDDYEPGHERWRNDPHVAAIWPEITLSLYWFEANRRRGGEREFYDTAFESIPVSDYRARPLLSVALAAIGNERALAWAIAELARLPVPSDEPGRSQQEVWERDARDAAARLPLRMLVSKQEPAREPTLVQAFCQGGIRRRSVIEAFRLWGDPDFHGLLARMATFTGLSPIERSRLLQAVMEMSARGLHHADEARNLADPDSPWLITRMLRGQPAWAPSQRLPLTCAA